MHHLNRQVVIEKKLIPTESEDSTAFFLRFCARRSTQMPIPVAVSLPELIWTDQCNEKLAALDKIDKPGGLGWPGTMRVGTAAQLLGLWIITQSEVTV